MYKASSLLLANRPVAGAAYYPNATIFNHGTVGTATVGTASIGASLGVGSVAQPAVAGFTNGCTYDAFGRPVDANDNLDFTGGCTRPDLLGFSVPAGQVAPPPAPGNPNSGAMWALAAAAGLGLLIYLNRPEPRPAASRRRR